MNKKAQIFELYLVVLTMFMCALVIWLYLIQQNDAGNSLVSPRAVLEIRDKQEIFEKNEKQLILETLAEMNKDDFETNKFSVDFKNIFLSKLKNNHETKDFLFLGLVREIEARENSDEFFKSIYSADFKDETFIFTRANTEKRFYLTGEEKNKINFPVEFSFVLGKKYLISYENGEFYLDNELLVRTSDEPKETKTRIIFMPLNWRLSEKDFKEAVDIQYTYFYNLLEENLKYNFEKVYFFDSLEYDFGGKGGYAPDLVEAKLNRYILNYDRSKDYIAVLTQNLGEGVLGNVWGQENIVLVKYNEERTLAHELGHAIFSFCDEYIYLPVSCEDKIFELQFKEEVLKHPEEYFKGSYLFEEGYFEELINLLDKWEVSEIFSKDFLENFDKCSVHGGWLMQNYINPSGRKIECQNKYPTCCVDSPDYLGDDNEFGVNCIPESLMSKEEAKNEFCAGMPYGGNYRSIMGIRVRGLHYKFPF